MIILSVLICTNIAHTVFKRRVLKCLLASGRRKRRSWRVREREGQSIFRKTQIYTLPSDFTNDFI